MNRWCYSDADIEQMLLSKPPKIVVIRSDLTKAEWNEDDDLGKADFEESEHPRDEDGNFDIPPTSEA